MRKAVLTSFEQYAIRDDNKVPSSTKGFCCLRPLIAECRAARRLTKIQSLAEPYKFHI